jgi:putative tricarboxylic transport membrane protein
MLAKLAGQLVPADVHSMVREVLAVKKLLLFLACLMLAAAPLAHAAEPYPSKVITIIVPFSAGGPTDTSARLLAQYMGEALKTQVIVENVAGAGGTIAAARVAGSPPDGYTVFFHHIGFSTAPSLYRKLPYDTLKDFEPVGMVGDVAMTMVARKDFPAKDLKEMIAYVKTNKEKVNMANAGLGAASHLCGMLFMSAIQTDFTTIPYKGTGPAMNDLLGGQVDFMCDQTSNTVSQIKAGKIKVYGVTTKSRVSALPDVPTMQEAGLPGFEVSVWQGLYVPKGTPQPVIDKLVQALQTSLANPTLVQRFIELGTVPATKETATPEYLRAHLKAEIDKWAPIIKKAGVYAD